jgi:hypothetical protein
MRDKCLHCIKKIVPYWSQLRADDPVYRLSMRYQGSPPPASIFPLLARWRSSLQQNQPPLLAQALRTEAQRCFRLARGIASFELADELEAIGLAFQSEAEEIEEQTAPTDEPFADELAAAE